MAEVAIKMLYQRGGYTVPILDLKFMSASTQYDGHNSIEPESWRWHHVAIQRSSNTLKMFINGIEGYSHTDSGNKSEGIILGSSALNYASTCGYVSNFRFVKGETVYSNFNPPTGRLTTTGGTYGDGTTNVNTSITASATKILINDWSAAIVDRNQDSISLL